MIKFDTLNTKIISSSVNSQSVVNNPVMSKPEQVQKKPDSAKQISEKSDNSKKWLIGATAVTASVIAGIAIYKLSKTGDVVKKAVKKGEEVADDLKKETEKAVAGGENKEEPIIEGIAEKILQIAKSDLDVKAKARAAYDILITKPEELARRIASIVLPSDKHIPMAGVRFTRDEAQAVTRFMNEPSLNYYLRMAAEESPHKAEISILDKIINNAKPLEEEAYVYRGLRTKNINDGYSIEEFAKDLKEGSIIENKGFTSTCRDYNDLLGSYDPINIEGPQRCGYIMRIKLPKSTLGVDARRFTGKDLIAGNNAEFILPRNAKIKVVGIDESNNVLECEYIL